MILFIWLFAILPIGYLLLKVIFGLIAHTASGEHVAGRLSNFGCCFFFEFIVSWFSMDFSCNIRRILVNNSGERGE
jgi:hypothetical protein